MEKQQMIYNPHSYIEGLKKNGIPFELEQTLFTKKITSELGIRKSTSSKSILKTKDLSFIGLVKNYCSKLEIKKIDRRKIQYIREGRELKNNYTYTKDIYEIDLSGAYWEFARKNKFISKGIYEKGLQVNKKVRLIALGNLAKRICILKFNGAEFENPYFKNPEPTEHIFWKVAEETDNLMRRLIYFADKNFYFYWCDAIFFTGIETKNKIEQYLLDEGIKFKTKSILSIKKTNHLIEVTDTEKKRNFNFRKSNNLISKIKNPKNK